MLRNRALPKHTSTYTYDSLQCLTGVVTTPGTYDYDFDAAGNRTHTATSGVTTTTTYDAADQRDTWSYDAAGNLLSDGTTSFTYDALNRVLTSSGSTNSYNGDGVLVAQTTGGVTMRYTQDLASPLSQVLQAGTTTYLYGHGDERLASITNGLRTWYGTDALGSVRMLQSPTGAVLARHSYDPWGQPQGVAIDRFGFTSELQQGSLVYLRARWYHAGVGTFTAKDPFDGFERRPYSQHPYQYGYSNPVRYTDPSGKCIGWVANWIYPVDPNCVYQPSWENTVKEGSAYVKGLTGVEREAGAVETALAIINTPTKSITAIPEGLIILAINEEARASLVETATTPSLWWEAIKQPWLDFAAGVCGDSYLLGKGATGIGGEVVAVASVIQGGTFVRNYLHGRSAAKAASRGAIDPAADMSRGLGKLAGRQFRVSARNLAKIERHLARFGDFPENTAMLNRLRAAFAKGQRISGADASFYFHELAEAQLMDLGIKYEIAHEMALQQYGVSRFSIYHPEVIQALPEHFHHNFFRFWGIER